MKTSNRPSTAFVAFGSNRGPRVALIERALAGLAASPGVELRRVSPLYSTEPVGGPRQGPFLNGVAEIRTRLRAPDLMARLLAVERSLGRRRGVRWGPRTIDLDLLTFGRLVLGTRRLTLPHPRYHERRFVLAPFCDLAPGLVHPVLHQRNRSLLRRLPASGQRATMVGSWKNSRFRLFAKRSRTASGS